MQSSHASNNQQNAIDTQMKEMWRKAQASYAAGDFPAAEAHNQRLVELQRRVLGEENKGTLVSMIMQGSTLDHMLRYSEAEMLYREVLQVQQQSPLWGMEHPDTLSSVTVLGSFLLHQKRYEEAEPMLRKVHATNVRVLGPRATVTLRHQMTLGRCLMHGNQLEEAERLLRDAWEGCITERVALNIIAPLMYELASCLTKAGKLAEAEVVLRMAVRHCRHCLGEHDELTRDCMLLHARVLTKLDLHPAAEVMYRLGVQVSRVVRGWRHLTTVAASLEWVECLKRQNKVEAAQEVVWETLEHV